MIYTKSEEFLVLFYAMNKYRMYVEASSSSLEDAIETVKYSPEYYDQTAPIIEKHYKVVKEIEHPIE
jgi:chemotaxis regulatin CheY-phosphate phosphatase CheZ